MYAKLFAQVVNSSLTHYETIEVRGVFFMMLAIADKDGNVPGVDRSIARIINVPIETFEAAVGRLMRPDPESQSEESEGRRLVRLEAGKGYRIVNYAKYQGIVNDAHRREYFRVKQAQSRARRRVETEEVGSRHPSEGQNASPVNVEANSAIVGTNQGEENPPMKRRGVDRNRPANIEEVLERGEMMGITQEKCRNFWLHHESTALTGPNGEKLWCTGGGVPITNWVPLLQKWESQSRAYAQQYKRSGKLEQEPKPLRPLPTPPPKPKPDEPATTQRPAATAT